MVPIACSIPALRWAETTAFSTVRRIRKLTRQKIEVLRRLTGPTANRNFPRIFESGRHDEDFLVVTEWVYGKNLKAVLEEVRAGKIPRPSVPEVVRLIRGLAHGLAHYHRRANLIHGDVSPANILVTDGTRNLVLIDFGTAWPIELTAAKSAGDGVTLPYAAPESINSRVVADFRADVFSLSVVAYELLTLEIPYDGLGGRVTSLSHQSKRLVPPRELLPSRQGKIPSSAAKLLDDYFQSALHPLPDYRFATRSDWLSSLDRLHFALQKGNRLRPWEETLLSCFEFLVRFGRRKQGQA